MRVTCVVFTLAMQRVLESYRIEHTVALVGLTNRRVTFVHELDSFIQLYSSLTNQPIQVKYVGENTFELREVPSLIL